MTVDRRHGALEGPAGESLPGIATLRELRFLAQVSLRVDPASGEAGRIARALGLELPAANAVASAGGRDVLWLGPDEWLVVGPDGDAEAIEDALRGAIAAGLGAVVDVSANRTTLELSGPGARDVLASCCPLDLHPRSFTPGRCARTLVAKAQAIVHQTDDAPTYRLLVRPSFAAYAAAWLLDAIEGLAAERAAGLA